MQQSQLVSQQSVDALKVYFDSTKFRLYTLTFAENSFSASFSWNGPRDITFNSVVVSADTNIVTLDSLSQIARCSVLYKDQVDIKKPFNLGPGSNVSITCDCTVHNLADAKPHNIVKEYPEGLVTVITEAPAISIPLIKFSRTITPDDRVGNTEASLEVTQKAIAYASNKCNGRPKENKTL